jgi:hypothetical protein
MNIMLKIIEVQPENRGVKFRYHTEHFDPGEQCDCFCTVMEDPLPVGEALVDYIFFRHPPAAEWLIAKSLAVLRPQECNPLQDMVGNSYARVFDKQSGHCILSGPNPEAY